MTPELQELLRQAAATVAAMPPEERETMFRAQRDSWVRAEMSWPKPNFKWVNGVKVYASREDFWND